MLQREKMLKFPFKFLCNRRVKMIASHYSIYKPSKVNAVSMIANERNYVREILAKHCKCIEYEPPPSKIKIKNLISFAEDKDAIQSATSNSQLQSYFSRDEMIRQLAFFTRSGLSLDPAAVEKLEIHCLRQYAKWPIDKQLFVLDLWFHMPESIQRDIVWRIRDNLLQKIDSLSCVQRIQLLFYVYVWRRLNDNKQRQSLEIQFEKYIDTMTLEVMSVWCLTLFRNKVDIQSSQLIDGIYEKLLASDLKQLDDIGLNAILKVSYFLFILFTSKTKTNHSIP